VAVPSTGELAMTYTAYVTRSHAAVPVSSMTGLRPTFTVLLAGLNTGLRLCPAKKAQGGGGAAVGVGLGVGVGFGLVAPNEGTAAAVNTARAATARTMVTLFIRCSLMQLGAVGGRRAPRRSRGRDGDRHGPVGD